MLHDCSTALIRTSSFFIRIEHKQDTLQSADEKRRNKIPSAATGGHRDWKRPSGEGGAVVWQGSLFHPSSPSIKLAQYTIGFWGIDSCALTQKLYILALSR